MARLFVDAQHGLCNRLRAIASAAAIAGRTGRDLVVIWRSDAHCACRLDDLVEPDMAVIHDDRIADRIRARTALGYNYMEIEADARFQAPILGDGDPGGDLYVRSAYTLNSPYRHHDDEQAFLRRLVPCGEVRDLLAGIRTPNAVAIHIRTGTGEGFDHLPYESRRNWPAHRHAELIAARARSAPARFVARLDALIAEGRAESVFLAADLPETYALFAARYGARVVTLPRDRFDRSARQLRYALADLILLTAADLLLASPVSSFSDMAQRLAYPGRPIERSGEAF